jgi:hypothetical protein
MILAHIETEFDTSSPNNECSSQATSVSSEQEKSASEGNNDQELTIVLTGRRSASESKKTYEGCAKRKHEDTSS